MSKLKNIFTCSFCGFQSPKWLGKCPDCDQWNTFYEELQKAPAKRTQFEFDTDPRQGPVSLHSINTAHDDRIPAGIGELDRVLGGGLVRGAVILIGGDPGIGKSTLVLQALTSLAGRGIKALYVSGEESLRQLRMRAERLGSLPENLFILTETSLETIIEHIREFRPEILVIDSVQTIYTGELESAPGSVSQLRETSARIISLAKQSETATFLVGHVTKEGAIAGPRVLEHMVDTVLYFEGDRGHSYRILRAVKNRFGSTDEIGVFEMGSAGLMEVTSPSELFISERPEDAPGSTVVPSIEGTRPILVEVQALTAPTPLAMPRRTAIGIDQNRTSVLVAVLEKKLGMTLFNQDIFLNVAGGIRLNEPGVDLGIITSIVSSKLEKPMPGKTVVCGEVGLTGEVRAISQIAPRIKEAERLGFSQCILPEKNLKGLHGSSKMKLVGVQSVQEAIENLFKN
ncbi:MAG: DNA repair protein RadA [Deltaproteobacteria bacterium]|nr:DNA repair protein RadA [Deltaproteobacteria bacterium]